MLSLVISNISVSQESEFNYIKEKNAGTIAIGGGIALPVVAPVIVIGAVAVDVGVAAYKYVKNNKKEKKEKKENEHTSNKKPSLKEKHENGRARVKRDQGGEKKEKNGRYKKERPDKK